MSKGKKNIEVTLDTKNVNGEEREVLFVGKQEVGFIRQVDEEKFEAVFDEDNVFKAKSLDEGIELLISQYNLHKG
ncbi:DUF2969 domain-containing protein [Apilactobacillus kunkeei]|uniref:DUF2969 domain-containing protein n=3 Tax=Apilactobacillus kunkeei TaxID=148814 RepID=A0AAC8WD12_9LACO|nr:DUF2969 domain-containing protein [Apilactobacillus kunkeei]ALJ30722.1 hypothetical protein APS55_00040 [Apilactobacillus kunkeei]ALJ32077.1 hypothetical protein APS55_07615 [Apilactobacillus kunkeei]KDB00502.1 hypothetical protein LAKU_22c00110 [Apilactobacillus kunkeei EFB6]KDB00661.1 hypothetical protein LAKU_17c00110 [Apilactobacillus kunkeei EFB6]KFJ14848.1 hypothetical protein JI66_05500 [Apilactobacillus kunkeei]